MKRKQKLMIRWSIVTAGLIALFWAIWYLTTGLGVMRIILGVGLVIALATVLSVVQGAERDAAGTQNNQRLFVVVLGIILGIILGVVLIVGLVAALAIVPDAVLGVILIVVLITGLNALLKLLVRTHSWTKIWNWLLVK